MKATDSFFTINFLVTWQKLSQSFYETFKSAEGKVFLTSITAEWQKGKILSLIMQPVKYKVIFFQ